MKGSLRFLLFHIFVYFTLIFQDGYISTSFRSEFPIVFYVYTLLVFLMLTFLVDTTNCLPCKNILGLDAKCPKCEFPIGTRSIHCEKCDKCALRFYMHSDYLGTCIASTNILVCLQFLLMAIFIEAINLFLTVQPLFNKASALSWIVHHIFLLPAAALSLHALIQILIMTVQLLVMVIHNNNAMKTLHKGFFEYYELYPSNINPFDMNLLFNINCAMSRGDINEEDAKELEHYQEYKNAMSKINGYQPAEPLL